MAGKNRREIGHIMAMSTTTYPVLVLLMAAGAWGYGKQDAATALNCKNNAAVVRRAALRIQDAESRRWQTLDGGTSLYAADKIGPIPGRQFDVEIADRDKELVAARRDLQRIVQQFCQDRDMARR